MPSLPRLEVFPTGSSPRAARPRRTFLARRALAVAARATGIAALLALGSAAAAAALPEHVPGEVLLKLRRTATASEATTLLETLGGEVVEHPRARGLVHLRGTRLTVEQAIERYRNSPLVEWIEPNVLWRAEVAPDDPLFPQQWGLDNTGQSGGVEGADIDAIRAWDLGTSTPVLVAVIDTGVDLQHPDLMPNLFTHPGEIADNGLDDDGNGFIDDVHGWDFVADDSNPDDVNGHGTHCAGVIGAQGNNGLGVAGVAWRVSILPVRFLDASGAGSTAAAIDAIDYAVAMGARVLNNSWGGGSESQALLEAIQRAYHAQVMFVAAAGNNRRNTDTEPHYPSSYAAVAPNVVSVAATDARDTLAGFSNYGVASVHLGAPGADVLSTLPNASYGRASGTSMAAPHVSGALALVLGRYPAIGAQAARDLLVARAEPLSSLSGRVASGGRLNLVRLLSDPDTTPPGAITDLVATTSPTTNSVTLLWTSVGEDGLTGTADRYEIRYAAVSEAAFDWNTASSSRPTPEPLAPGAPQQATVSGLPHGAHVTFEVRAVDEFGNEGPPSARAEALVIDPPMLVASEDTLRFAVRAGEGESHAYRIENHGASDLVVDIEFDRGAVPTTPMRVLILHSAGNVAEIRSILTGLPRIERVDTFNARTGTPTAAELRFYDVVLLSSTQAFAHPAQLGDALAEYVDGGGGVLVSIGSFVTNRSVEGRFRNDGYLPFKSTLDLASNSSLGPYDRAHPIMAEVVDITTTVHAFCDPAPDAELVALWRSGAPFVVTRARAIVGINAYFGAIATWDQDMPVVVYNAAQWVRGSGNWLTSNRSRVTIPAGGHTDLQLTCGAVSRVEGRYGSTVRLKTNDPARPALTAGAVLDVTGTPGFALSGAMQPVDSVLVGGTGHDTLSVFNPGTAPVAVRVHSDDPRFSVSFTEATLRAGERRPLIVSFVSDAPGTFTGRITVEPGSGLASASTSGTRHVVHVPRLEIATPAPDLSVDAGGHVQTEVTLRNTGGSPLGFHVNVDGEPDLGGTPLRTTLQADVPVISRAIPLPLDFPGLEAEGVARVLRVGGAPGSPSRVVSPQDPGDAAEPRLEAGGAEPGTDDPIERRGRSAPEAAPGAAPTPGLEVFGGRSLLFSGAVRWRGNAYACTRDMTLHEHRFFMGTGSASDLWFAVYESPTAEGSFRLISVSRTQRSPIGEGWFSSGDVDVPMRAGHHYMVLTQFRQPVRFWGQGGLFPFPVPASFGALTAPVGFNWAPVATVPPDSVMDVPPQLYGPRVAYYQALVTGLPAPWLTASPRQGVIAPGAAAIVTLNADLTQAVDGTLAARMVVDSDDPEQPRVELPVRIRVRGIPRLALGRDAFDLGDVIVGEARSLSLEVSNPGSAVLEVSSIVARDPRLVVSPQSLRLAPREQAAVSLRFAPTTPGDLATTIDLHSNDAAAPLATVVVAARVLPPPRLAVGPTSLAATVAPGALGTAEIVIENPGESPLHWAFQRGSGTAALPPTGLPLAHDLESVRSNVDANGGEIRGVVPASVEFVGGESGSQIDGGLFLGGNVITTDLFTDPLPYTGGQVQPGDDWFGPGSRYATVKRPGLFLLIADLAGADLLATDGQMLTQATQVDHGSFDIDRFGVLWRGLYKRSWSGPGPSVTRLVLVPDAPLASQTTTQDPRSDLLEVSGLSGASRVVSLLFAHAPGTLPTAEQLVAIMAATLDAAGLPPPWLSLDPGSGSIPVGGRAIVRATLDARRLTAGSVTASLAIASNVPNQPATPIEISVRVVDTVAGRLLLDRHVLLKPGRPGRVRADLLLPTGLAASDLVPGSVRLAGVQALVRDVRGPRVRLRVDRVALAAALPVGRRVPVVCTAELVDGRVLEATDTLRVRARGSRPGDDDDDGKGKGDDDDDDGKGDDDDDGHGHHADGDGGGDAPVVATDALLALPANPVRAPAGIRFRLAHPAGVNVALYDAGGRRARTFAEGAWGAGTHTLSWDGRDDRGHPLAPGVYFLRIEAGTIRETARWVWLR